MTNSERVSAAFQTDQGRVRRNNQDFVAWREPEGAEEEADNGWLYILADGAGGMDAGEVASKYATERTLHHYFAGSTESDWGQRLYEAMQAANSDLRELSVQEQNGSRMATTMVATVISGSQAHIANVGDSRAYLWRQGKLTQITRDQSLVAKLLEDGVITPEEAENHPRRNVILYSLGSERNPRIDLYTVPLRAEDRLLLCSDGLTRHVPDEEIALILGEHEVSEAAETLINLANERGGQDNISVGILAYQSPQPTVVRSGPSSVAIPQKEPGRVRVFLLTYTIFLSFLQSLLILLAWAFIRL